MNYLFLSIILLGLGISLLFVEVLIPGFGIFGVLGVIFSLISLFITIFLPFGFFLLLIEIIIICISIYFISKIITSQKFRDIFILENKGSQENNMNYNLLLGKEGIVKTTLKPFGKVNFNGLILEVTSSDQLIKPNTKVKVIDVSKDKIVVIPSNKN